MNKTVFSPALPPQEITTDVLLEKYAKNKETTEVEIFERVSRNLASVEKTPTLRSKWKKIFKENMIKGGVGAGRIMSAAGTDIKATLLNCYVVGVGDTLDGSDEEGTPGIYEALRQAACTMQKGGGVGYNFSKLRPKGSWVKSVQSVASGPCSYIDIFDASCKTIESAGCFAGDSLINTTVGLVTIREIVERRVDYYVNTHLGVKKVTAKFTNGVKPLIEVTSGLGFKVKVTKDHKFGQYEDGKIVKRRLEEIMYSEHRDLVLFAEPKVLDSGMVNNYNLGKADACADDLGFYVSDYVVKSRVSEISSYLAGLFENLPASDWFEVCTSHYDQAQRLQLLLTYIGVVAKLDKPAEGSGLYKLKVVDRRSETRLTRLVRPFLKNGDSLNKPTNKAYDDIRWLATDDSDIINLVIDDNCTYKEVAEEQTYDLEVEDVHLLSGNGFYTSNSRRGAQLAAMNINHPDVLEFVKAKRQAGRWNNFNVSVLVTDDFMHKKNASKPFELIHKATPSKAQIDAGAYHRAKDNVWVYDTINAQELWDEIMQSNYDYAEPGILFYDNINNDNNLRYVEVLEATNPCVTGDTLILTPEGHKAISSLVNVETDVWNGYEWSKVTPRVTGENRSVYDMLFSDGTELSCTLYHGFILENGNRVQAKDLTEEHVLSNFVLPVIESEIQSGLEYVSEFITENGQMDANCIRLQSTDKEVITALKLRLVTLGCSSILSQTVVHKSIKIYELVIRHDAVVKLLELGLINDKAMSVRPMANSEHETIRLVSKVKRDTLEPKVYCFTDPLNNSGLFNGLMTANCGEVPLAPNGCCDLGPIILPRLVNNPFQENAEFDYKGLADMTSVMVRMLDNVLDASLWPLEQQRLEAMSKRRIGVGFTGLANAIAMCNRTYHKADGLDMADKICRVMKNSAYETSARLAEEKGSFPLFDVDKFLEEGTSASRLPETIKALIRKKGIRNSHLLSIAPTGCLATDSLIVTDKGLIEIGSLKENDDTWQTTDITVLTDEGYRKSDRFFINGVKPVKEITDDYGFKITGTDNHRLRVITEQGNYEWKRLDALKLGDVLVKCINTYPKSLPEVVSKNIEKPDLRAKHIKRNIVFSERIAEFVGFLMSNGNVKTSRHIRMFHHTDYSNILFTKLIETLKNEFGIEDCFALVKRENNPKCDELSVYSSELIEWLTINGAIKKGSKGLVIPNWVMTGDRKIIKGFLRGLYEGDGSGSINSITYTSIDGKFITKLQQLLLSIGILSRRDISNKGTSSGRYGANDVNRLSIGNRKDKYSFMKHIGFMSNKANFLKIENGAIERMMFGRAREALINIFTAKDYFFKMKKRLKDLGVNEEVVFSAVTSIEQLEPIMTVDISVPSNLTYVANGFVSHNTISLAFADNASNGIEPPFSLAYTRKKRVAEGHVFYNVLDHSFRVWLSVMQDQEFAAAIEKAVCAYETTVVYKGRNYNLSEVLPKTLVTAMTMSPDEHLSMMKTVQPYICQSISKTVNVHKDSSFDEFKKIYDNAWAYKLKGVSTYRPNDILGSVLSVEKPAETKPVEEPTKPIVKETVAEIVDQMYANSFTNREDGTMHGLSVKGRFHTEQGEQKFIVTINFINLETVLKDNTTLTVNRPIEFILTSDFSSSSSVWQASMRFMSLLARSGVPMPKIIENMTEITWEHGKVRYGSRLKDGKNIPLWHNSDVAAIGYVIQKALIDLGHLKEDGSLAKAYEIGGMILSEYQTSDPVATIENSATSFAAVGKSCPECNALTLVKRDGCEICSNCGYMGSCG